MEKRKKLLAAVLALCLLLGALACAKPDEKPLPTVAPVETEAPAATVKPAETTAPTAEPKAPAKVDLVPFWTYEYEYGGMKITVSKTMAEGPADQGESLLFTDPEGAWTATFTPLSLRRTEQRLIELEKIAASVQGSAFYRNAVAEDQTGVYADESIRVSSLAFERNPDMENASDVYSSFKEGHLILFFDFGNLMVKDWSGLEVDVALPAGSMDPLDTILGDEDLNILLHKNTFETRIASADIAFAGMKVSFPARWQPGTNDRDTLWATLYGEEKGSIYFGTYPSADPKVAAGYITPDYRTLTFNGRAWYGGVITATLSGETTKRLELYTDFTAYHAAYVRLSILNCTDDEALWAYAEGDTFRSIMESVVLEPESFHNPEDDLKDAEGFECNNVNEISAYTGDATEILIPAQIGETQITGINTEVFKNNTAITKVVLAEGIQRIGYATFQGCTSLKEVVLPNSLTYINSYAFEGCTALESVTFGNGLQTIDTDAFRGCAALGDVLLPETVRKIGNNAFMNAGAGAGRFLSPADGVVYGYSVLNGARFSQVTFGPNADLSARSILYNAAVGSVTIGEGCVALGEDFLGDTDWDDTTLQSLTLPASLKVIPRYAISGRRGLTSLDLKNVEELGEGALSYTGLVDIVVPGTVKVVPNSCFSNCEDVLSITLEEGVEELGEFAFGEAGRRYQVKRWTYFLYTPEEAAEHPEVTPNGTPPFDNFIKVYVPSTLQKTGYGAFCGMIGYVYMNWLTDPAQFPSQWDVGTFASAYVRQVFFPQETIDAHMAALDALVSAFDRVDEVAYYDEGTTSAYWVDATESGS